MTVDVYGLYARDGFPVCEMLSAGLDNSRHENLIEIARRYFLQSREKEFKDYAGIMLILGSGDAFVYSFK